MKINTCEKLSWLVGLSGPNAVIVCLHGSFGGVSANDWQISRRGVGPPTKLLRRNITWCDLCVFKCNLVLPRLSYTCIFQKSRYVELLHHVSGFPCTTNILHFSVLGCTQVIWIPSYRIGNISTRAVVLPGVFCFRVSFTPKYFVFTLSLAVFVL